MSIKEHIINNFKGSDIKALKEAIDESVSSNDEVTLPGLGIFLCLIWENTDHDFKNKLLEKLESSIKKETGN